jgi:hypothetical protein
MPATTADSRYSYDHIYFNHSLEWWVQNAYKHMCDSYAWSHRPLRRGAFGFDNLAVGIARALEAIPPLAVSDEAIARTIHQGWAANYVYWRDSNPEKREDGYRAPYSALGDERRNRLAESSFDVLDSTERDKDLLIARFLLQELAAVST